MLLIVTFLYQVAFASGQYLYGTPSNGKLVYFECAYYYKLGNRNCPPSQPSECHEGQLRKDENYCTKYEICHSGRFEQRYCPYGSGFNGYHCENGYRCNGESGVEGICQESAGLRGFLPDRTDCGFFYQCAQGRWIRKPCAPGTHYNPTLGGCDHIGNVRGCRWSGP